VTSSVIGEKNVLLVGATSYVGAHLLVELKRRGYVVHALSSSDCDFRDSVAVERMFRSLPDVPVAVIFCAVINKWKALSYEAYLENTALTYNLVQHHKCAPVTRIIYFSTAEVYGRCPPTPITEATRVDPDSWYAVAKYVGEWSLLSSGEVACPVTVLRIPGIYGAWPNDHSIIGKMIRSLKEQGSVAVTGDGGTLRDYVFLPDLSHVVVQLLTTTYHGLINVGTGKSTKILSIGEAVCRVFGKTGKVVLTAADATRDFDLVFDISTLRRVLPSVSFTDLDTGIRSYVSKSLEQIGHPNNHAT
jgi:nucleoside-diphosphate-sugar epimerase